MKIALEHPRRLIVGTVGQPGARQFFVQATGKAAGAAAETTVSMGAEKLHIAELANNVQEIIDRIVNTGLEAAPEKLPADNGPLETPVYPDFQLGAITVAYDESEHVATIEFLSAGGEDAEDDDADRLRVELTLAELQRFVVRAKAVVAAGRQPCPLCSFPLDPAGHVCPRANGYRR